MGARAHKRKLTSRSNRAIQLHTAKSTKYVHCTHAGEQHVRGRQPQALGRQSPNSQSQKSRPKKTSQIICTRLTLWCDRQRQHAMPSILLAQCME